MLRGLPVLQRRLVSTKIQKLDFGTNTTGGRTFFETWSTQFFSLSYKLHVVNDALLNMMNYMPWCMMRDAQVHNRT
jgi:hypothetical protein